MEYLVKVLDHDRNLLDGQGVHPLMHLHSSRLEDKPFINDVHLVNEALNISAEVGDADRLDPRLEEFSKLSRDGLCLRGK